MTSLYLHRGGKLLLLYRIGSRVVAPSWCGVGGHFEKDELNDALSCVLREAREEIGIEPETLHSIALRYITLRLKNGEVRQNYYFFAELGEDAQLPPRSNEGELRWFTPDQTPLLEMPHTAKHVLSHYLNKGQYTNCLYAGTANENGVCFHELTEF